MVGLKDALVLFLQAISTSVGSIIVGELSSNEGFDNVNLLKPASNKVLGVSSRAKSSRPI